MLDSRTKAKKGHANIVTSRTSVEDGAGGGRVYDGTLSVVVKLCAEQTEMCGLNLDCL